MSTHPSTIARAVASAIDGHHLQMFHDQVVKVEASILKRESGVVGGYDIVALARILTDFDGWDRILQYLDGLTNFMLTGLSITDEAAAGEGEWITGAQLTNKLRQDIHTGYPSLEEVSMRLLQVAETAWLRQISTWVLYGRLPTFGGEDFFVKEGEGDGERVGDSDVMLRDYIIDKVHLPEFVTPETATSILFIGRSLSHVRIRGGASIHTPSMKPTVSSVAALSFTSPELGLLPVHLSYLQSLRSPLSPPNFSSVISSIRLSLSRHTLRNLLPPRRIVDVLHVFREFFLLGRGEFAIALVAQAEDRVRSRYRSKPNQQAPSFGITSLLKEGEVSAVLTRTWSILSSFQCEEILDERLELAREFVYLSLHKPASPISGPFPAAQRHGSKDSTTFSDLLVGAPVYLSYHISWPMELFLTSSDVDKYNRIFQYLIASRKCLIKLQSLWHGRRVRVAALGLANDRTASSQRREILKRREQKMRFAWATAALVVFFLETLEYYWQGEVIEPSFQKLTGILGELPDIQKRKRRRSLSPESGHGGQDADSNRGDGIHDEDDIDMETDPKSRSKPVGVNLVHESQQDPESLSRAHRLFLHFILRALFISDHTFPSVYRTLLETSSNLCTWISSLENLHALVDLRVDSNHELGQSQIPGLLVDLDGGCRLVRKLLDRLVVRLQKIDEERSKAAGALMGLVLNGEGDDGSGGGGKVDRLLMRLNWDSMGGLGVSGLQ